MNLSKIIRYTLWGLLYLVLQILVFRSLGLFDYAFCFVYIGAVLLLPAPTQTTLVLILSFVLGLCVDFFYNTFGLHAAASVLVGYLRPYWIQLHLEAKDLEVDEIDLASLHIGRFITFLFPLLFIHSLTLFAIEAGHLSLIVHILSRAAASTFFTLLVLMLLQSFVHKRY